MHNALLLSAALLTGQVEMPRETVHVLPAITIAGEPMPARHPVTEIRLASGSSGSGHCASGHCSSGSCTSGCSTGCCSTSSGRCNVQWLKPWTCKDLEMKPVEPAKRHCCGSLLYRLLYCPEEEKKDENGKEENGKNGAKNGKKNGDAKNGDAKNGDKKDENGEEKKEEDAEEPALPSPLMQWIRCRAPSLHERMECNGTKVYGWVQGGYTVNFDSPRDRLNYGTNFNNRSNDLLLNQFYLVLEKTLDLDKKKDEFHTGYRVDFLYGHDAPYFENIGLGLLDRFNGDRLEASRLTENGIGLPQFYYDIHAPILTKRGVDFRIGRMFTHQTFELSPANQTNFYSHSYEYFYGMPFTHLGAMATVHLGDTVDILNGIARGWDVVFQDNNDSYSYIGSAVWNSCDKRQNVALSWMTGPEQLQNNHNNRTTLTGYYTKNFGCYNQWKWVTGGCVGWEQNAAINLDTGATTAAEWYAASTYLFYTINPKLILGARGEWFRDDDGTRTVFANSDRGGARWNRPGYAGNFYDLTLGATLKPFQNLRLRPELRFDWFDGQAIDRSGRRPFNDQRDRFQTTLGMDVIWEF